MSHIDRYSRQFCSGLICPCLFLVLAFGASPTAGMQLETPNKFQSKKSLEAGQKPTGGVEPQLKLESDPDAQILKLLQELKILSSATKELREAQDRIDARILAIENRLNLQAAKPSTSNNRLWRSIEGKTIIATLTKIESDKVVLTRNGKQAKIPLKQLCRADQEFVASQAKRLDLESLQRADIKELGVIR